MTLFKPKTHFSDTDIATMLSSEYIMSHQTQRMLKRNWIVTAAYGNTEPKIAVTITFKQHLYLDGRTLHINKSEIRRFIRKLHNQVNRKLLGNAFKRYKRKVFLLAAIEGGGKTDKRLHCHLSIGIKNAPNGFLDWFKNVLRRSEWVDEQIKLKPLLTKTDEATWHYYLGKQYVDLNLLHLNRSKQQ